MGKKDSGPREHVLVVRVSEVEKAILDKKVKEGGFDSLSSLVRWYLFCR